MFDFGFWEVALIGVITLIVVGPERLPGIARKVGLYVGKIKRFIEKVKNDVSEELDADKLKLEASKLKEQLNMDDEDSGIVDIIKDTKETLERS